MKHVFTSLFLSAASFAAAQPTLTFNTNGPQPGGSYSWSFSPYVAPGSAGAGQVWDFSQLTADSTTLVTLVDPTTTTFSDSFPTATVAEVSDGSTVYFRATANGVHLLGYEAEGSPVVFSDEGRFMTFPCVFHTNWTDAYSASFTEEGTEVEITGDISGTADGHGTLVLPTGSISNVLRVHWVQEEEMDMGQFTFNTVFDNYLYFVPGRSYPIVQTVTTTSSFLGNTTVTQFTKWVSDLGTDIPEKVAQDGPMDLFPVPSSGELNFTLPAHFSGTPLVTITDASGRGVRGAQNMIVHGTRGRINVSGIPAGIYMLTATDELGQRAKARFVVQ